MSKEDWDILIAYLNFNRRDFWEFLKDEQPRTEDPNARLHPRRTVRGASRAVENLRNSLHLPDGV